MRSSTTGKPAKRSTASYAILGLLSVRTWTTYELAKQVQRSLNWFWPRAERKLYDEPKRLVADGLATATRESTGIRSRTVYEITDDGRDAHRHGWTSRQPRGSPSSRRCSRCFFSDAGTLDQLDATLAAIEREATERLAELATMADQALAGATAFPHRLHLGAIAMRLHPEQEATVMRWAR